MRTAIAKVLPTYVRGMISSAIVPVKYAEAVKALAACQTIDESKYWADKADALAAWAKIYQHDEASKEARKLKIHAYDRMGKLSIDLQPGGCRRGGGIGGRLPGPQNLLEQHGLSRNQAASAMAIARASEDEKERFIRETRMGADSARVYRPFKGTGIFKKRSTGSWNWLFGSAHGARLSATLSAFRSRSPQETAAGLSPDEAKKARKRVIEIIEWLDEFEHCLPAEKK